MPAPRPAQGGSGGMTAALVTFVVLFIIAAVLALMMYLQVGKYQTLYNNTQAEMNEIASTGQAGRLSQLVGTPPSGQTYVGALLEYVDGLTKAITGNLPEDTTAAAKFNEAILGINEALKELSAYVETAYGPDGVDLLYALETLRSQLESANADARAAEEDLYALQQEFDQYRENLSIQNLQLMEDKEKFMELADQIQQDYEQLRSQMDQASEEQLETFTQTRQQAQQKLEETSQQLQETMAKLDKTQQDLTEAIEKIEGIKPRPDIEVEAFRPDAQIVNVDLSSGVVFLNIGSDDHVYRGLTFSVYDPSVPIPEDGQGKAEIEVFRVMPKASAARINRSQTRNPITRNDIVANLIWESEESNTFAVAGEFDIDRDGIDDPDGREKVIQLIERWGGTVTDTVDINTDFVLLGNVPKKMMEPTLIQIENDPMIQQRYEQNQAQRKQYNNLLEQARNLHIPIFNQERFFYLIGYESLASKRTPL